MDAIDTIEMIEEAESLIIRSRNSSCHGKKILDIVYGYKDEIFKRKFRMSFRTFEYIVNEVIFTVYGCSYT